MALSETILALMDLPKYGAGPGLHRMAALCSELLDSAWAAEVGVVNVVGSNGKGSVAHLVHAMQQSLLPTEPLGVYTSPHLLSFHERMRIRGVPISEATLRTEYAALAERIGAYQRQYPEDTVGAFEAFTALALGYFAQQQTAHVVLEAGIGGRYDSTRILTGRVVALTSLDLEHTQLLGSTLEEIAYDKLDLAPAGATAVVGPLPETVRRKAQVYAQLKGLRWVEAAKAVSVLNRWVGDGGGWQLDLKVAGQTIEGLDTPFLAEYSIQNLQVALATVLAWQERYGLSFSPASLESALRQAVQVAPLLGRFQRVQNDSPMYLDLAHTPNSIPFVKEAIRRVQRGPLVLVTGVSYDKEVASILQRLAPLAEHVVCTRAYHKGASIDTIFDLVPPGPTKEKAATVEEAIQRAQHYAQAYGGTVLIAGGLFLSMEAYACLQGQNPKDLRFF